MLFDPVLYTVKYIRNSGKKESKFCTVNWKFSFNPGRWSTRPVKNTWYMYIYVYRKLLWKLYIYFNAHIDIVVVGIRLIYFKIQFLVSLVRVLVPFFEFFQSFINRVSFVAFSLLSIIVWPTFSPNSARNLTLIRSGIRLGILLILEMMNGNTCLIKANNGSESRTNRKWRL